MSFVFYSGFDDCLALSGDRDVFLARSGREAAALASGLGVRACALLYTWTIQRDILDSAIGFAELVVRS